MFVILAFIYSFSLKEIKKEKHFAFMTIQFMHKSMYINCTLIAYHDSCRLLFIMKTHRQTLNYLSSHYLIVSKLNLQHYFVKTKILYN